MNNYQYVIYARKSSENEDRQVLSIEAQINELKSLAEKLGLRIIDILTESMSAKQPGRPVFNKMIERVHKGEIQGILCWKLDRLARNPVDGGNISWVLQQGILKEIQTHGQVYKPTDNVLMMAVELGMANQFIRDLSVNTKRGIRQKAEKGYPTGQAKLGYLNDKTEDHGNRFWIVDQERFEKVQLMFRKFLRGGSTVADISRYAREELLLTTIPRKRIGGKVVTQSYVYEMLRDPIYAGYFFYEGKRYELNKSLPRVISESEFKTVKDLLLRNGQPREEIGDKDGVYNYFMKCGHCGCAVTHDKKQQIRCSECGTKFSCKNRSDCPNCRFTIDKMDNLKKFTYDYYRCFKRKEKDCPAKSISGSEIQGQLVMFFQKNFLTSTALSGWLQEKAEMLIDSEIREQLIKFKSLGKEKDSIEKERMEIIKMRAKNQISDEELEILRSELTERLNKLEKVDHTGPKKTLEKIQKVVLLSEMCTSIMSQGTPEDKREFLGQVCSNLTLTEKKVEVTMLPEIKAFVAGLQAIKSAIPLFEPEKVVDTSNQNPIFIQAIPSLLRTLEDVRTYLNFKDDIISSV